jgi:toxin-antitoxin system PIN domain toxin
LAEGDTSWALPIFCLGEFLRVVTHPRVFTPPTTMSVATEFVDQLCMSPSMRLLMPGSRFWSHLRKAASVANATGNLVFDAQIAALCYEAGIQRILTEDRDFSRFERLHVERLSS